MTVGWIYGLNPQTPMELGAHGIRNLTPENIGFSLCKLFAYVRSSVVSLRFSLRFLGCRFLLPACLAGLF